MKSLGWRNGDVGTAQLYTLLLEAQVVLVHTLRRYMIFQGIQLEIHKQRISRLLYKRHFHEQRLIPTNDDVLIQRRSHKIN